MLEMIAERGPLPKILRGPTSARMITALAFPAGERAFPTNLDYGSENQGH
jgi:hypothetical protein